MADIFLGKASVFNQMGMRDFSLTVCEASRIIQTSHPKRSRREHQKIRSRIEKHQVLTVSPEKDIEIVQIQDRYEVAMAQREALQLQLYIAYLLILLILVTGGIIAWFRRRCTSNY